MILNIDLRIIIWAMVLMVLLIMTAVFDSLGYIFLNFSEILYDNILISSFGI